MLEYILSNINQALKKNDDWLEIRFEDISEKTFDDLSNELKQYEYKKYRLECYPRYFLVRFDLRNCK